MLLNVKIIESVNSKDSREYGICRWQMWKENVEVHESAIDRALIVMVVVSTFEYKLH